jgi:PKD repeat protein
MKNQRRPYENLIKTAAIILIAASGLLSAPFQAAGQTRSKSLLNRFANRKSTTLKVAFAYSPRYPVVGQTVRFTDASVGDPTSWNWDFGDGTVSTERNPIHVYTASGFRHVTLVAADSTSSKRSSRTLTVVAAQGDAAFVYSPATPGVGQPVQFSDTTPGNPSSWSWNFGDGTTSSGKNPIHTFAKAGGYAVSLMATTSSGPRQTSKTITVASMSVLSSSFFYTPAAPVAGQSIQFMDTSDGNPTSWNWNFGDGTTSTLQNPSHAYATAGAKTVGLTVTNASGTNSSIQTVTVGVALDAAFTYSPGYPAVDQTIQFTDGSTGSPTSWSWSFGDGTTSTLRNPSHAYATAGAKTVTLTVANSSGSNSVTRTVPVASALTASFTYSPASPVVNQSIQFADASAGSPASWRWNFGDGSTSTARYPRHAYATAGAKTVTLTVTNGSGSDSVSRTVTVGAVLAASFTFSPSFPAVNQSVQFTDASTGSPTAWSWNFGDGATSASRNPTHAFAAAGSYTVTLMSSNASTTSSATRTVTVAAGSGVVAAFMVSPAAPVEGQTVQFSDASTGSPTAWAWDFNDGATSGSQNPAHAFAAAGSYSVTLVASNANGSSSATKVVTVAVKPNDLAASFTFSPSAPKIGDTVQFTDTSTGGPVIWQWDFGDGATSAAQNPSHVYGSTGSRTITLTVSNGSGSNSASRAVTVTDSSPSVDLADRWIDWSGAGVPGGIAQYRDGGANARSLGVSVLNYGADPTGAKNSSTAFANAQSACPAGSYIYIPNGTYLMSGSVSLASDRTWRGQSVTGTIIKFSGGGGFASPAQWPPPTYSANGVAVTAGATKGSRVLTVASTSSFSVGGLVQLTQLTPSYMHANSSNSWTAESWFGYDSSRLSSIMFTVAAVDSAARKVTLDHALPQDMTSSPLLTPRATLTRGVGFENLQFDCTNSTSNQVIQIVNATSCWIYGCYFKRMYDRSAWFEEVTNCTFEHNHSDHGQGLGRNCEGLDFVGNACWCLVQDNTFHSAGYPMIMFGDWQGGCAGNVVGYNFLNGFNQGYDLSTAPLTADDSHGPPCVFNLWEGNVGEIFGNDGYYGSAGFGTYFRNRIWGTTSEMDYADQCCLEFTHWSYMYTVVGNVLGTPAGSNWNTTGRTSQVFEASGGSFQSPQIYRLGYPDMGNRSYSGTGSNPSSSTYYDTNVKATLIRHGNYDYVNQAVLWESSIANHVLPTSLYLQSAPSWYGAHAFPAIGPDVAGYTQNTPASARWAAYLVSGRLADLF